MREFVDAYLVKNMRWLDSDYAASSDPRTQKSGRPETEFDRWVPFVFLHAGCFLVFITGCSVSAVTTCIALYCIRMFAITGFYHRYFSHKSFKTGRVAQFIFAVLGCLSVQRGPLWWAAHHRHHHAHSDEDDDVHSPVVRSFLWSHIGWITSSKNMVTHYERVRDFDEFPELRFLNRFDWLMPAVLFIGLFTTGEYLRLNEPALHTSGLQLIAWGFFLSTAILFHATASINSLAHCLGYRRYDTNDSSKNNPLLALVTFGEGWHNNHHRFSSCVRQGFTWWEIDLTYYGLLLLNLFGVISDLKPVPKLRNDSEREFGLATVTQSKRAAHGAAPSIQTVPTSQSALSIQTVPASQSVLSIQSAPSTKDASAQAASVVAFRTGKSP